LTFSPAKIKSNLDKHQTREYESLTCTEAQSRRKETKRYGENKGTRILTAKRLK